MHHLSGCVSWDAAHVVDFIYDSLQVMSSNTHSEYGIAINGRIYKHKGIPHTPDPNLDFGKTGGIVAGIGHIHSLTNPEGKYYNVGPYTTNGVSVVAVGHFGQYIEMKTELEKQNYTFSSNNFAEVFTAMIVHNKRRKDFSEATILAMRKLYSTHTYAIMVTDIANPDQLIVARKGNYKLSYAIIDESVYVVTDVESIVLSEKFTHLNDGSIIIFKNFSLVVKT